MALRLLIWLLVVGGMVVLFSSPLDLSRKGKEQPPSGERTTFAPQARHFPAEDSHIIFTGVTEQAGVRFVHEAGAQGKKWYPETIGAGGGFFDYDGDGLVDILLVNGRRWPGEHQPPEPTMHLYRNQGDGTFRDVTRQSGLAVPLYGMGMAAADYDNDGDQDLLITGYQPTRLFRNNGDGTFTHVSMDAGIAQGRWSTAALFVDVDRDGRLDLVVGYYVDWDPSKEETLDCTYGIPDKDYCAVTHFVGQGLTLYRNLGDGRFQDVTVEAGMQAPGARVLGLTSVDYNQDGRPDVVVANDLTPSLFFANNGDGTFLEIGVQTGLVREGADGSVVSSAPTDYLALKRTAIAHYQAGRVDAAIDAFEQVLQRQPADYIVQQYLIELHWRRGARGQARVLLTKMAQGLPEANFLMQFGFHLEAVRLPDLAGEVYREAARLDPKVPEAVYRLGKIALEARRYAEAVAHFHDALNRQPNLRCALRGLGLAYAAQGKTDQAEAQFQAVIRLAPDFAEAYTHLGKIYARTGRLDEAIQAYQKVIELDPDRAQGHHNLGAVLAAKGLADVAMVQFQEALRRDPHYLPAHNDLGALYAERGEIEQAIAAFAAVVRLDPSRAEAHYNLAMAYAARGDAQAMIQELQETLRLDPRHVEAHLGLGIGYLEQGGMDDAVERLRTVVRLDPHHARAHSALATLYFRQQQYELAWQHGQRAAELGAPVQPLLEALRQVLGGAQ